MKERTDTSQIGILCWEAGQAPRGLVQLETLKGNSTNPDSYDYPVRFHRVVGANIQTILENPDRDVLARMIEDARSMVSQGIKAIVTSCGFNAIFQRELADALDVPVFTSSLLQVPMVLRSLGKGRELAIITAKRAALRKEHFESVGITSEMPVRIFGMEQSPEWNKIFVAPDEDVDLDVIRSEVVGTALDAVKNHPAMGAFVLECTDLPPFAEEIRKETGLPVFDIITLVNYIHESLSY